MVIKPEVYTSTGEEETLSLGRRLAPLLKSGSIVALRGTLGAGKTCFAKGIARGLGIEEELTSPTYSIVSEYECTNKIPLYHIDAYRLNGNDDFSAIGGEEIVFGKGISLIEWSDRIEAFIPPDAFRVDIKINEDGTRLIRVYSMKTSPGDDKK